MTEVAHNCFFTNSIADFQTCNFALGTRLASGS